MLSTISTAIRVCTIDNKEGAGIGNACRNHLDGNVRRMLATVCPPPPLQCSIAHCGAYNSELWPYVALCSHIYDSNQTRTKSGAIKQVESVFRNGHLDVYVKVDMFLSWEEFM